MLPVGLGLNMLVGTTLLTTLIFFLLLPLFTRYRKKGALAFLSFLLCIGFMVSAHMKSKFTKERPKPTSLLYVLNSDEKEAIWASYEHVLADWTQNYITGSKMGNGPLAKNTISSKYGSSFTYTQEAPLKDIPAPTISIQLDTVINTTRKLRICITPQRPINRLEVFTNAVAIGKADVNSIPLSEYYLKNRKGGKLITHYISDIHYTELTLEIDKDAPLELTIYEASNDLLDNPDFSIPKRPEENIPMPFVLNDAILIIKKIRFE